MVVTGDFLLWRGTSKGRPLSMNRIKGLRAVLIDSYPLWLDAVENVLERLEVDVVGTTTTFDEAIALVEELQPDLIVTEIKTMLESDLDGLSCLRRACRIPGVKVVVFSSSEDPEHIESALEAGAAAYVVKTAHPDDFASAIRQAFQHSIYLSRGQSAPAAPAPVSPAASPGLTRRELEILQLVAEGHSNAQLAKMLWVTEQTVKFHLSNIYRKLDVSNRTEASRWAQRQGLLPAASAVGAA